MEPKKRQLIRICLPCAAFLIGVLMLIGTANALAIPPAGPGAGISQEAWLGLIGTGLFMLVAGFTARNDKDIREIRKYLREVEAHVENRTRDLVADREVKIAALVEAFREQFNAVSVEQRQQQSQINMLSERVLREHPRREDFTHLQNQIEARFDKLESLVQRSVRP